ncbi:hypothetical protein LX97_03386 [Nonlabens dokdonensis]|uniref:Uncharacterized protein n=2 Tax=Nonlabens dokdonensis TaxID=328515 RepID=L7W8C4_NONDD|nr:alpha-amylase [Nonlabens dokdonensis]AGC77940.1 hypothetical protein DDD_2813 [Nonlabens dokdonensis DSW-6]PZX36629.1 hypothetical protein LX97_03386 [Nonlabens dokdonensis]
MALGALAAAASGAVVLKYIETGIKVADFLISERLSSTVENIRSFFDKKEIDKPSNFDLNEAKDFIDSLMQIDMRILDTIRKDINEAIKKYTECLKDAINRQEKNACDIRAERAVCDSLNRIMDRNGDNLPSKYLKNQWKSFKCVRI